MAGCLADNADMTVTHPAVNPATITVYGADWCGDCRRTKRLLAERGVAFAWVDVATQPEIRAALAENGYPAIPVVVLADGRVLMEPSDAELDDALDPASGRPGG